jgi:ubiquinone/menaquinone biosynthesis C-methylase UbiE
MSEKNVQKNDVKEFWTSHPLGSYERDFKSDSGEFHEYLDKKRDFIAKFIFPLYEFEKSKGKKVLELGCGPGLNIKRFAENGAKVCACDISTSAVKLSKKWFNKLNLEGVVCLGDAEKTPFKGNEFDFVLSDGVLHHTPGIDKGLAEVYRAMKPGGKGLVSVYYDNLLLRGFMFKITKLVLWTLNVKFFGNTRIRLDMSKDEFGRLYDGPDNVLGKIYSKKEITDLLKNSGFKIIKKQLHYFPTIFLPFGRFVPEWLRFILDRTLGCMIYFQVSK